MEDKEKELKEYELLKQEVLEHQKRREQLFIITTTAFGVIWGLILNLFLANNIAFSIVTIVPYILVIIFCRGVLINSTHIICIGLYIRFFIEEKYPNSFGWESAWDRFAQTEGDERKSAGYWYTLYFYATVGNAVGAIILAYLTIHLKAWEGNNPFDYYWFIIFTFVHFVFSCYSISKFVQKIHWGKMNWAARQKWNKRWNDYKKFNIVITNNKIAGFNPIEWASFRGFSLLFDNPGDSLILMNESNNVQKIHCNCSESGLEFYNSLANLLGSYQKELAEENKFCPLPMSSFHVTVWDGINDESIEKLKDDDKDSAKYF